MIDKTGNEGKRCTPRCVLVGVDLSQRSEGAFARASALAAAGNARLILVHAVSDAFPEAVAKAHREFAERAMERLASEAKSSGVREVVQRLLVGRDAEMLVEQANAEDADLVVLGTHRRSTLMQDLLGTTVDRVMRYGHRPVLLARASAGKPYGRILVCVDFSPASRRALGLALRWFPSAELQVLNVSETHGGLIFRDRELHADALETRRLALKSFVAETVAAEASQGGLEAASCAARIKETVDAGHSEDGILRRAEDMAADLIVIGTHARTGLQYALIGSVAEIIVEHAAVDVLAVPPHSL